MSTSRLRAASRFVAFTSLACLAAAAPALAENDGLPPSSYVSLPDTSSPETTGSLPHAGAPIARSLSGFYDHVQHGSITLRSSAPTRCVPGDLKSVVAAVAARFGPVSVESTHRSRGRNWRAGGARQSLHLSCRAIDFRVRTRTRGVMAFLRAQPQVGGLKVYRNGVIHIDDGERRSW